MTEQRLAELIRGKTIKDVVEEDFWDNETKIRLHFTDGTTAEWTIAARGNFGENYLEKDYYFTNGSENLL